MTITRPAALLALLTLLAGCYTLPDPPPPTNPIRFLSVNDVYVMDTLADGTGGLARVAMLRDRLAAEGPTLFVLAGDALSPSLASKYYGGRQMIAGFNAAELNYATFGNHEFTLPRDTLSARIAASAFIWLSANCVQSDGTPFPGVRPWDTVTVAGATVGLFGVTLPADYPSYVRCTDPADAAGGAIDTLRQLGADLIVGITHQTAQADQMLMAREPDLDLILGGHEHEARTLNVGGRYILKADANARSAQFATLWGGGDEQEWRQAVTLVAIDHTIPADTAVQPVVEAWSDSLRLRLGAERVVGVAAAPIDARDAVLRRAESALGDLVADAMRAGTGADVALINAGAMRLDDVIPAGPVSNYRLESIFRLGNETRVITFPITGARLRALLEHGVSNAGTGGFLQISGISFTFDPERPGGDRIVGDLRHSGAAIQPGDTLMVAFTTYPACEGGDGFNVPEAAQACAAASDAPRAADLLIRHITQTLDGRIELPAGGRIVRADSTAAAPASSEPANQ